MPWELAVDAAKRLTVGRAWGVLTDEEFLEANEAIISHPGIEPDFNQLLDLSEVTSFEVSTALVRALVDQPGFFTKEARRAVVAPSPAAFGTARMFQSLQDGRWGDPQVFRTLEEALRWLGAEALDR